MDPNTDINQDPVAATDTGATSFTPNFDMTAINEAVAAGPAADEIPADPAAPADPVASSDPYGSAAATAEPTAAPVDSVAAPAEEQPQAPVAGFVDGDLTNDAPVAPTTPEPVATDPVEAFSATPEDVVGEVPVAPQEAEPTTIADLANNTDAPMAAPAAAPVEPITPTEPAAPVTPAPAPAPAPINPTVPAGKSKVPTYVLIGLALVAVVSVVIAVIVSLT